MSFPYLQPWLVVQAASWLCVLALAGLTGTAPAFAVTAVLVWLVLSYAAMWRILGAGGTVADRVTLLRFVALLVAAGVITGSGRVTWPAWLVLVAVALADLLDGYCARRFGGSAGGAILDMETDQFAFVVLALLALLCPKAPA